MKAAILKAFGSPLAIETVAEPVLGTGEVIVDVMASRVLAYANEVLSGERKYLLELPIVPGPGAIDEADAASWCALGTLLVPYGGFLAARLQPGETVLVNGATGSFGSAAIA